jgi:hypothetical protein
MSSMTARLRACPALAALALLLAAAACIVDIDYAGTRLRCPTGKCPDGFTCTAGLCEARATGGGDAGGPDGARPDAAAATCDDLFGAVQGYMLCEEQADRCVFSFAIGGTSCDAVCGGLGSQCLTAQDNADAEPCTPLATETCDVIRNSEICTCTRP